MRDLPIIVGVITLVIVGGVAIVLLFRRLAGADEDVRARTQARPGAADTGGPVVMVPWASGTSDDTARRATGAGPGAHSGPVREHEPDAVRHSAEGDPGGGDGAGSGDGGGGDGGGGNGTDD